MVDQRYCGASDRLAAHNRSAPGSGAAGRERTATTLAAKLQTDDEINAWIYGTNRDRPVRDVLAESRQVFQQLATVLAAFPEAELRDPQRFPWAEGELLSAATLFAHFHEEHEPDIRAWLAQQEAS